MLANLRPEEVLRQVVELLLPGGKPPDRRDLLDDLLHMIACKAAIKAGDRLSPEEVHALLEQRHDCQERTTAPTAALPPWCSPARNSTAVSNGHEPPRSFLRDSSGHYVGHSPRNESPIRKRGSYIGFPSLAILDVTLAAEFCWKVSC